MDGLERNPETKALSAFVESARQSGRYARPPSVLRYGRVFFDARADLGLSTPEYLLADVVHTLSRRTGWCYASRGYLARLLGVSVRQVQRHLSALRRQGLLESRATQPRQIRTTSAWDRATSSCRT